MSACERIDFNDGLLDDILYENSCFDLDCDYELEVKQDKPKKRRNRKRKCEQNGRMVEYIFSEPVPKVFKSDIRRSYANMLANCMNSGDFPLLFGFLNTFCAPAIYRSANMPTSTPFKEKLDYIQGVVGLSTHWYKRILIAPDSIVRLLDTQIVSFFGSEKAQIVAKLQIVGNLVLDEPPVSAVVQKKNLEFLQQIMSRKRKMNDDNDDVSISKLIMTQVQRNVNSMPLRNEPVPLDVMANCVISIDEHRRISGLEVAWQ